MTEFYAAVVGGVLGFAGALLATTIQSNRDEKRSLRAELTHLAAQFVVNGADIALLNLDIYDKRLGGNRDKSNEGAEELFQVKLLIDKRNSLRLGMEQRLSTFRIGYPQLAGAAQEYFDVIDNRIREDFSVIYVECLPVAQEKFESDVRHVLRLRS